MNALRKALLLASTHFLMTSASLAQQSYKDIAPILINNCTGCHHNGGIAFSLGNYSAVVANNVSVKYDLLSNKMPNLAMDLALE